MKKFLFTVEPIITEKAEYINLFKYVRVNDRFQKGCRKVAAI